MFSTECHGKGLYFLSFKCISIFPPSKHPSGEIAKRKYQSLWHLLLKIHSPVFTARVSNKFHDSSWLPVWRYNTWIIYTLSPHLFFFFLCFWASGLETPLSTVASHTILHYCTISLQLNGWTLTNVQQRGTRQMFGMQLPDQNLFTGWQLPSNCSADEWVYEPKGIHLVWYQERKLLYGSFSHT